MKRMRTLMVTTALAGILSIAPVGAALAGNVSDPVIQQKERDQQQRIDAGIRSGQLTPAEAARLQKKEDKIKQKEAKMKADGNLTLKERKKLNRQLDRTNKKITQKKNNPKVVQ